MGFLDFFRSKGEVALLYDIGNASVGCALVIFSANEKPKFVYTVRKEMPFGHHVSGPKMLSDLKKAIDVVSHEVIKNGFPHLSFTPFAGKTPSRIHCVIASPWYASQTRIVSYTKETSFEITKKLITDLVLSERKTFLSEGAFGGGAGTRFIEETILHMKLNGYPADDFYGKQAFSLEFSVLMSIAPEAVLETILTEIRRHVQGESIAFSTFPVAGTSVLRKVLHEEESFLFLDVGGELTDVSLVRGGVLLETSSFPLGMRSIIRSVDAKAPGDYEHAKTLLHLFTEGTIAPGYRASIEEGLMSAKKEWIRSFEQTLEKLVRHKGIPPRVYFTADSDVESFIISLISDESFHQYSLSEEPFTPISVSKALLSGHVRVTGAASHDPFLMIGALFANHIDLSRKNSLL